MKRMLFSAIALSSLTLSAFAPVHTNRRTAPTAAGWTVDKAHTNVIFSVSHLVVSDVEGKFTSFDGTMDATKPDFSDAKINFTIDVKSVTTDNEMRDNHLKSDDFFAADKFPQMKFVSTALTPAGEGKYTLTGNLTIRDITKPISFDVKYGGTVNAMGGTHAGFKAKTTINRFDYNLKWDKMTEAGGAVVGKEVEITLNVDMKKS